jgi:hypothetical protein
MCNSRPSKTYFGTSSLDDLDFSIPLRIHNQREGGGKEEENLYWIQMREKLRCANNVIGFKKYEKHLS